MSTHQRPRCRVVTESPQLGDDPAPWHYRGWLLPYVIMLHAYCPAVADRWGYHLLTLAAGRLLEDRDLAPTTDLRSVAKGVLSQHLGLGGPALASVFPASETAQARGGLIRG